MTIDGRKIDTKTSDEFDANISTNLWIIKNRTNTWFLSR